MRIIKTVKKEFYKGQKIDLECHGSVAMFSYGVVLKWGIPGESEPREIIPCKCTNLRLDNFN
jgi:hypothetical protein